MPESYAKGSEWRKWDLHLHSFYTHMNNNYKSDNTKTEQDFVDKIVGSGLKVIGLTNYFNFKEEDYQLKKKLESAGITVFLNLEIRLTYQNKEDDCCDFHIIFDNGLEKDTINLFLSNLNVLVEGHLKKASKIESSNDYLKGVIELDEIINKIKDESLGVSHRCLAGFLSRGKGNGRTSSAYEKIYEKTDFLIHSSENPRNLIEDQKFWAQYNRPLFQSSDAHSFSQIGQKYSWVKADPTFRGLRQTLNEMERICLDDAPELLKKIKVSPQNFIKRLFINKKQDSIINEIWFNNTAIDINPGLVAIIGNKGSGKSAIADITSLCANTHVDSMHWSFLKPTKFRMPRPFNRSKAFEAHITWADDSETENISLDSNSNVTQPERVKYIPQNFLEELCTTENDKDFEKELKSIIFQYLPEEQKYGKIKLDDVIDYLSQEIIFSEKELFEKINEVNKKIVDLEAKQEPKYIISLKNNLELKRAILENLKSAEPPKVEKPVHEDNAEDQRKQEEITSLTKKQKEIEDKIVEVQNQLTKETQKNQDLKFVQDQIVRARQYVNDVIAKISPLLETNGLKVDDVISLSLNTEMLGKTIAASTETISSLKAQINNDNPDSLSQQKEKITAEIVAKQEKLGEADRKYQKYVEDLKDWNEKIAQINGSETIPDTIIFYEKQIEYVEKHLEGDLQIASQNRDSLVVDLLNNKKKILTNYARLFAPITEFIERNKENLKEFPIEIQSTFIFDEINEKFFDFISQGVVGSFSGKEAGAAKLKELCDDVNLNNDCEICAFAKKLESCLKIDDRESKSIPRDITNQLKKGHSILELYNYIYGLSYIKPLFQLQMSGKKLASLSPGERGAILLLFYLFIDNDDKPLIIDQPEENLDNESVYKYLVSFIKAAKKKRQIIMVTHNPNLAVVCDADQIIKMDIDKVNKNTVSFVSGSIENPAINQCVVDVLEGTYPAFDNRKQKYFSKKDS